MKFNAILLFIVLTEAHLKDKAKKIYVGSSLYPDPLTTDVKYKTIAAQEFSCVTPELQMKWAEFEKGAGHPDYVPGDQLIEYANQYGMKVRGHTLIWHYEVPKWIETLDGNRTALENAMIKHVKDEVTHYKGKIYCWDVVNEVLEEDGSIRKTIWSKNFGTSFLSEVFKLAHSTDPNAKLYINEYGTEGKNNKSDALYTLVKELKAQGVPIDGVGFQAHFELGDVPQDMAANMQRFADLGLDVAVTELDIRMKLPVTPALLEQQTKEYVQVFDACLSVSRCVGVTVWEFTDKYSWIPGSFKGYGAAHLWDSDYKPKPAVSAIEAILH